MVRASAEMLRREMVRVFPQLRAVPAEYAWGGTLDVAFDMMPHAGQLGGLHYAIGYAGHGVYYTGAQLGRAAGRRASLTTPFAGLRFPGAPLGSTTAGPGFCRSSGPGTKFWIGRADALTATVYNYCTSDWQDIRGGLGFGRILAFGQEARCRCGQKPPARKPCR